MSNHPETEVQFLHDIPIEYTEHEPNQNQEESDQHQMILTIDIGNKIEQLKIYDITNPNKDIYEFCLLHKLNYYNMEEITKQTMQVIAQQEIRFLQTQNEMDNSTHEDDKSNHNAHMLSTNNIETFEQEQIPQREYEIEQELSNISPNIEQQLIEPINSETEHILHCKNNHEQKNKHKLNNNKQAHKNGISNRLFAYEICNHNCKDNNNDFNNCNTIKASKRAAQSKPSYRKNIHMHNNNTINTKQNTIKNNAHINRNNNNKELENNLSLSIHALLQNDIIKKENNKYIIYKTQPSNTTTIPQVTPKQTKHLHHNLQKPSTNMNTDVYERNIKFKENAKKHLESLRNILNQSDNELFTFKPKINPINEEVLSKRQKAQNECNNPERIRNYKQYIDQKLEQHKINMNYGISSDDLANCTFKPEINRKSELIDDAKRKSVNANSHMLIPNEQNNDNTFAMKREQIPAQPNANNINRFEKLYLDTYAKQQHLQQKATEINEQFTYNPEIISDNSNIKTPFNKRLEQYHSKSKEKIIKIANFVKEEEKGCHPFQPNLYHNKHYRSRRTITSNNTEHNNSTLNQRIKTNDVFSTLYLYNQIYSQKKTNTYHQINKIEKQQANTNNTCKSSNELIYQSKLKAFKKIFSLLDSDGDGEINSINKTSENGWTVCPDIS